MGSQCLKWIGQSRINTQGSFGFKYEFTLINECLLQSLIQCSRPFRLEYKNVITNSDIKRSQVNQVMINRDHTEKNILIFSLSPPSIALDGKASAVRPSDRPLVITLWATPEESISTRRRMASNNKNTRAKEERMRKQSSSPPIERSAPQKLDRVEIEP